MAGVISPGGRAGGGGDETVISMGPEAGISLLCPGAMEDAIAFLDVDRDSLSSQTHFSPPLCLCLLT